MPDIATDRSRSASFGRHPGRSPLVPPLAPPRLGQRGIREHFRLLFAHHTFSLFPSSIAEQHPHQAADPGRSVDQRSVTPPQSPGRKRIAQIGVMRKSAKPLNTAEFAKRLNQKLLQVLTLPPHFPPSSPPLSLSPSLPLLLSPLLSYLSHTYFSRNSKQVKAQEHGSKSSRYKW